MQQNTEYTFSKWELRAVEFALRNYLPTIEKAEALVGSYDGSPHFTISTQASGDIKRLLEKVQEAMKND